MEKIRELCIKYREIISYVFFGARGLSGIIENGGFGLFVTHLGFNAYIVKFSLAVFVVIVNYVLSKFFIFKKR